MSQSTRWAPALAATLGLSTLANAQGDDDAAPGEASGPEQEPAQSSMDRSEQAGPSAGLTNLSAEEIKEVQRQLVDRALYHGKIDGIAGPRTLAALRAFQQRQGLKASGEWDASTAAALGVDLGEERLGTEASEPADFERRADTESATFELSNLSSEQVLQMQQRLFDLGHYDGEVDGVIGPMTRAALRSFFHEQLEFTARGKLSESAMMALGIDSEGYEPLDIDVQDSPRPHTDRAPVQEAP
jgi:peptidoglycan hydrolase-like protein with peptidoglycan-binding domain